MSISQVQSRIADIESRIAQLNSTFATLAGTSSTTPSVTATGTDPLNSASGRFAAQLQSASGIYSDTSTGASPLAADVISEAKKYVGMPYVWGGSSPSQGGMDCSGLVQYVYGKCGIDLPRVSADQARQGVAVDSLANAQPGDLLAWDNSSRNNGADHIAIYLGDGKILEAPRTGLNIRIISLAEAGHGSPDYIRRVLPQGPVTGSGSIASLASGPVAGSTRVSGVPFADAFNAAAMRHGVSAQLLAAVAKQESGFNPRATSPAGAQGLMQFMPGTARDLGINPLDPMQAIDGAARYLKQQIDRFGSVELGLAAYNAGPGNVAKYGGIPPFEETQNYVRSILSQIRG